MEELRPLLATVGLVVVAAGLLFWVARLRGWHPEWWERFISPGGRRQRFRAGAGEADAGRSARGAPRRAGVMHPSSTARRREADQTGGGSRAAPARGGAGSGRQPLSERDFLPLPDPEDGVGGATTTIDREYDMGDLGAIETGGVGKRARSAPPVSTVREAASSGPRSGAGRRTDSKPRRPSAAPGWRTDEPAPRPPDAGQELLIVLTIIAPDGRDLAGPVIAEALTAFELRPDDHGMFHHYGNRRGPTHDPVFSVANVLEPGVFDLAAMDQLVTPGLCLFLRRPGPLPGTVAFDLMLDVGARLARALEAALCDDQRCRLTLQATQALRERVINFALRHERGTPDAG